MDYFPILLAVAAFGMGMVVSLGIATWLMDRHVDRMEKLNNSRMLAEYNLNQAKNALKRFDELIEKLGAEGQTLVKYTQVSMWRETIKESDSRTSALETELITRITDSRKVAEVSVYYSALNDIATNLYREITIQNGKIREQTQARLEERPMTDSEKAFLSSGLRD